MTNEEIVEAKELIVGLKNDLTVIAGSTDVEKLIALLLEKKWRMLGSFYQLHQLCSLESFDSIYEGLLAMCELAGMAQRQPGDYTEKLLAAAAKDVPRIMSDLDKIMEHLATQQ